MLKMGIRYGSWQFTDPVKAFSDIMKLLYQLRLAETKRGSLKVDPLL